MELNLTNELQKIATVDLFKKDENGNFTTGLFVGRTFSIDYDKAYLLVADKWKFEAKGLPQGAFMLAYYENEEATSEAMLLRVLRPCKLPTDNDVISSMVEYYKENLETTGKKTQLDAFTQYEFSFSGVECRILGTFYKDEKGQTFFGADVENFYSAHHYKVVKPNAEILEKIVNFREGRFSAGECDIQIGSVRYSSSQRFHQQEQTVPVFVSPRDFLGKRTALFGMTRTGKSNTVKKVIQATAEMSKNAPMGLVMQSKENIEESADPFTKQDMVKYKVGQIIFDINGEYANKNLQDEGTAIFDLYKDITLRYSTIEKKDFKVMKVNFYADVLAGFELVKSNLELESGDYIKAFCAVDLNEPEDKSDVSAMTRYERRKAAYLCSLFKAGFKAPKDFKVKFKSNKEVQDGIADACTSDPAKGISLQEACNWFEAVWDRYDSLEYFKKYRREKGREWADEDLKAIFVFLTRKTKPAGSADRSGYKKITNIINLHTDVLDKPYDKEIIEELRNGKIIIIDLSQGDPNIQKLYSERICKSIFASSMDRFINTQPNNFIQFYFEEAHNLFPKKDDKDLSQIYNRLAKEGAKLNLGLIYATQEVSSISSNILKNTQNWFIAHLNNEDETKEIKKYYDFGDFTDSLVRFSAASDKGFVKMKTYSNPFVVPVQIDKFSKA